MYVMRNILRQISKKNTFKCVYFKLKINKDFCKYGRHMAHALI